MDSKALFEILIRENTEMLLAFLRTSVRDKHAVDDLYQETFLTAWKRIDDYDRKRPFGPWLRGIASRTILTYYRTKARADVPIDQTALEWLDQRFEAIHAREGDTFEEKLSILRQCISDLPDSYQAPITLRYLRQQTSQQIESLLRLTSETLRKRFTRAKSRLADCVERKLRLLESSQ